MHIHLLFYTTTVELQRCNRDYMSHTAESTSYSSLDRKSLPTLALDGPNFFKHKMGSRWNVAQEKGKE